MKAASPPDTLHAGSRAHQPTWVLLAPLILSLLPGPGSGWGASGWAATPPPDSTPSITHAVACTDYTQGKVVLLDPSGQVTWEYQTRSCNDLWVLPNGNLLFNTGHGVREVTRQQTVVFDYSSPSEIYACQRLPNGNTFVGECNSGRLLEIEPSGRVAHEVRLLPEGRDGGHLFMRNARVLPNGHFLVTHYGEQVVREYRRDGTTVATLQARGGPHSAVRLPNGNTVVTCGDLPGGSRVFEADPAGTVVWEVRDGDLPGIPLKFLAGLHRLPNGNTVVANWLGHGQFGTAPHLVEITPGKRVVWTLREHPALRTVSSVLILDTQEEASSRKDALWH